MVVGRSSVRPAQCWDDPCCGTLSGRPWLRRGAADMENTFLSARGRMRRPSLHGYEIKQRPLITFGLRTAAPKQKGGGNGEPPRHPSTGRRHRDRRHLVWHRTTAHACGPRGAFPAPLWRGAYDGIDVYIVSGLPGRKELSYLLDCR